MKPGHILRGCLALALAAVLMLTALFTLPVSAEEPVITFSDDYEAFLTKLGYSESHNNYSSVNPSGYYGRWQTNLNPIKSAGLMASDGIWTKKAEMYGITSMDDYLHCPLAQYYVIYLYHRNTLASLLKLGAGNYLGTEIRGVTINVGGIVGMSHKYGAKNVIEFLKDGGDGWDTALGVVDTYSKYEISNTLMGPEISFSPDPEPPVINSVEILDIMGSGYTLKISATDNMGVSQVKVAAWTEENDQDDLVWKTAEKRDGCYWCEVETSEHRNEYGVFINHVYVYDIMENYTARGYDVTVPEFSCKYCIDDMPKAGELTEDLVYIAGWCFNKETDVRVFMTLDGVREDSLIIDRPDVKSVYKLSKSDVGFAFVYYVSDLSWGTHDIVLYAENPGGLLYKIGKTSFTVIGKKIIAEGVTLGDYKYTVYKSNYPRSLAAEYCASLGGGLAPDGETENLETLLSDIPGRFMTASRLISRTGVSVGDADGFIYALPIARLFVETKEICICEEETEKIIFDSFPDNNVSFVSSAPGIASVSADGTVTGVSAGGAEITVTYRGFTEKISVKIVSSSVDPGEDAEPGDVTGDGKIDNGDLIRLKKYLAGQNVKIFVGADMTLDGKVNNSDLIRLKKHLAGQTFT